jgi:hypothetical protein
VLVAVSLLICTHLNGSPEERDDCDLVSVLPVLESWEESVPTVHPLVFLSLVDSNHQNDSVGVVDSCS